MMGWSHDDAEESGVAEAMATEAIRRLTEGGFIETSLPEQLVGEQAHLYLCQLFHGMLNPIVVERFDAQDVIASRWLGGLKQEPVVSTKVAEEVP